MREERQVVAAHSLAVFRRRRSWQQRDVRGTKRRDARQGECSLIAALVPERAEQEHRDVSVALLDRQAKRRGGPLRRGRVGGGEAESFSTVAAS